MQGGPLPIGLALWVSMTLPLCASAQGTPSPTDVPYSSPPIQLEEIPGAYRERCKSLLERPTFRHSGASELFAARSGTYIWLLDNPDRAVTLWRMIGAQCSQVERRGDSSFGWKDANGSDVQWETILRTGTRRAWYAEGKVKPALLIPGATVRALIVVHHQLEPGQDTRGRDRIRHRAEFFLQTDSHILALAARIMGASAPRLAEQFSSQIQMFFGGLSWYLDSDPERAQKLFERLNAGT